MTTVEINEAMSYIEKLMKKAEGDIKRAEQKNGVNDRELENLKKKCAYFTYAHKCMYFADKVRQLDFLLDSEKISDKI